MMKRALIVVAAAAVFCVALPAAAQLTPWTADFDTYNLGAPTSTPGTGWNNIGSSTTVVELLDDGHNALRVTGNARNSNLLVVDTDTGYPYSQVISFDIMFPDANVAQLNIFQAQTVGGTNGWNQIALRRRNGNIEFYGTPAGGSAGIIGTSLPVGTDTWYHVEFSLDFDDFVGWVTVNGALLGEIELPQIGMGTNTSQFNITASGGGEWYLRNVSVNPLVPEPATMSLLGLGALALFRRRK